jgi:hypothetical protein
MGDQYYGQPLLWTATIREQVATAMGDQRHEQLLPWIAVMEEQTINAYRRTKKRNSHYRG